MRDRCEILGDQIRDFLIVNTQTRRMKDDGCLLQLPFRDSNGDPVEVGVYEHGEEIMLSDVGSIAGNLFTLGQHTQDTPAFKLLGKLERAYGLRLDYDNGRVTMAVPRQQMNDAVMDFGKVILTMLTAIPHIRVEPHRLKPLGQRLRTVLPNK